ncbi:ankyrin repeat domain-containing protein 26-like isoform X2 [Falco naumanni]|uniref:ankyrin repeat domain-containing protein 26-like isoform X2 n=1 Tax=Falco naumanni TaxID=148594 RepID=UPI001ADEB236|nr:ankyrin repeat domain-containing protein 26-like isoform X2 [Falco naumanni]
MRGNHEKLEKSKSQLKEEVANLKHHMETNVVDRSQIELYKREVEEQAAQEIRQKLQEVNLILQVQQELDEKIAKELKQVTAEFEAGSAGASPMVFSDGSSKSIHVDQDPLCRAVQEYRDVLTKNYLI